VAERLPEAGAGATASGTVAERVAAYYDANTQPFYLDRWHPEDLHFGLFPPGTDFRDHRTAVKVMTAAIASPARIEAADCVLDAGCGVGGAALDLARDTGAHVLGVTVSPVQVELATARASERSLAHLVRFERADCSTRLPCEDESVDVVVTIEAACHFADKGRFLDECRRVLRPGGRLAGSDWMAADGTSAADAADYLAPVCDAWKLAGLETPKRWSAMLAKAGFDVRECVDLAETVIPNARILARARLDLMLEVASGGHPEERATLWQQQYDTLMRAWFERRFTIGRFFAVAG
jgi:cyclopropane fatty-acyl-phospholipid synthase-like methyltransferase